MTEFKRKERKMWDFPLGYKESFILAFGLVIIGFIIELISSSSGFILPSWPFNIIILVATGTYIAVTQNYWSDNPVIKWLSSTQAAIVSISIVTVLVLIMGFVPQTNPGNSLADKIGFTHIVHSWPFILSSLFLLIVLGFTTVRRILPFSVKNFAFFLNHFGLWLILAAGFIGSSDSSTLMMQVSEGQKSAQAYDKNQNSIVLPFAIQLNDFKIEEYEPQLVFVKAINGKIVNEETKMFSINSDNVTNIKNYEIGTGLYLKSAYYSNNQFEKSEEEGSAPAAYLKIKDNNSGFVTEGWVSCGSYKIPSTSLELNNNYFIAMNEPSPKKFTSEITVFERNKPAYDKTLEVNKPFKIQGWKTYQLSYDVEKGKWSKISVFELVRDPWLFVVYIGIFMVLGGAVYLFWTGNFSSKK